MNFITGFFASLMIGRALNDLGASDRNFEKKLEEEFYMRNWQDSLMTPRERMTNNFYQPEEKNDPWPW
jgi:hypothetical protein